MNQVVAIAKEEWRYWLRSSLVQIGIFVFALLLIVTSVLTANRVSELRHERVHQQEQAEQTFRGQPDRHPHRMVHYGHYAFRAPTPLAQFDPGVDAVTGQSIFLEGHRQNSAMFAQARGTARAGGFGTLTPALIYQLFLPLLLIAIGHAAIVREREGGTLVPLMAQGVKGSTLYWGKAVAIPLWIGGAVEGSAITTLLGASLALLFYILFWGALVFFVANARRTGSANLTYLTGVWFFLCAILPALLVLGVNNSVSLPDGENIVLTQREAVNDAWDIPKEATYRPFLERQPEWKDYTRWDGAKGFEWKWYYAFQQVGDQTAETFSEAYRDGRLQRDKLMSWLSVISPASFMQRQFEKIAQTDTSASLAYETRVRNFHMDLRQWHYPRLFKDMPYEAEDAKRNVPLYSSIVEN